MPLTTSTRCVRIASVLIRIPSGCSAPETCTLPRVSFPLGTCGKAHINIWDENLSAGERNVRGTAEMGWALEKIPGLEHLMAYESLLNTFIWGKSWISICLYDVNRFPGATVMKVLQTHPFVITGGGVFENPYFVHPRKWLSEHAPEFLTILESPE